MEISKRRPGASSKSSTSRKAGLLVGTLAVGSLVLAPNIGHADPQPTVAQVQAQLDKLYQQAADADESYNAAQVAEQQLQGQLDTIRARIAQEQTAVLGARSKIGSIAATQYRTGGGVDPTMQMMMQGDPQKVLDMAGNMDRASSINAAALRDYVQAKSELDAQGKSAADKLAQLDKTTKDAASKKKQFDDDVAKTQQVLGSLQEQQRQQLVALQAQKAQQQATAAATVLAVLPTTTASSSSSSSTSSSSSSSSSSSKKTVVVVPVSGRAAAAVAFAQAQLGKPYIFGGTGPVGYDCSGLTSQAWASAGVSIPRTATAQMLALPEVSASNAQPGDLVFFYGDSSYVNHVGMYIGGGMVIHASQPGEPISIAPVSSMPVVSYGRP